MQKKLPALDAAADAKTEFFLAASHQLKSPVAVIQWCLNVMLETPSMPPEQIKMARKALDQANGMSQLLGELLHVFRLSNSQTIMEKKPLMLNSVVEKVLERYADKALANKVVLEKGPFEHAVSVNANEQLLEQVIVNIVDNAIKYSREGGHVVVTLGRKKHEAILTIKDQGIGIADAEKHKLFTEFFRGTEAREVAEGTGLGLVLVKQVAEKHGGEVLVESSLGKGTEVIVKLPLLS